MKTFKIGGIHPKAEKLTADCPILPIAEPKEVRLMLSQSIGAPSKPIVKMGDYVVRGQKIADAGGFVSAPIHASISGRVKKIDKCRTPQGYWQDCVVIESCDAPEGFEWPAPQIRSEKEIAMLRPEEIVRIIAEAGIVGLGGATFPTAVKLTPPKGMKPEVVIINGAECEPYLTCDDRLMRAYANDIILGAELLMRAVKVEKAIVGIEENKPEAIAAMIEAAAKHSGIEVVVLKKKYPQGGEKQLIAALTGRQVPSGALPVEVGAIVDNVATAWAVARAVRDGLPLTERVVTVTGPDLEGRGNFMVPFGTSFEELLAAAGGVPENTGKIVAGGPMMGRAVSVTDTPTTKGLSGLLLLPSDESRRKPVRPCIRCGACVAACPMGLEPYLLMAQALREYWPDMKAHGALNCIECGSCSYVCPSSRPLLDFIKLGKQKNR